MQAIFDSISDGVIVADENGNLTFNPSAERIVGLRLDTLPDQWTEEYRIFYTDKVTRIPYGGIAARTRLARQGNR